MFVVLSIFGTRLAAPFCALFWTCFQTVGGWLPLTFVLSSLSLSLSLSAYKTDSVFVCLSVCLLAKICYKAFASFTHRRSQATQQFIKVCSKECNWQRVSWTAVQCVYRECVLLEYGLVVVLFARFVCACQFNTSHLLFPKQIDFNALTTLKDV